MLLLCAGQAVHDFITDMSPEATDDQIKNDPITGYSDLQGLGCKQSAYGSIMQRPDEPLRSYIVRYSRLFKLLNGTAPDNVRMRTSMHFINSLRNYLSSKVENRLLGMNEKNYSLGDTFKLALECELKAIASERQHVKCATGSTNQVEVVQPQPLLQSEEVSKIHVPNPNYKGKNYDPNFQAKCAEAVHSAGKQQQNSFVAPNQYNPAYNKPTSAYSSNNNTPLSNSSDIVGEVTLKTSVDGYQLLKVNEMIKNKYSKNLPQDEFETLDKTIQNVYYARIEASRIKEQYGCEPPLGFVKTTKAYTIPANSHIGIHGLTKVKHGGWSVNVVNENPQITPLPRGLKTESTLSQLSPGSDRILVAMSKYSDQDITIPAKTIISQLSLGNKVPKMIYPGDDKDSELLDKDEGLKYEHFEQHKLIYEELKLEPEEYIPTSCDKTCDQSHTVEVEDLGPDLEGDIEFQNSYTDNDKPNLGKSDQPTSSEEDDGSWILKLIDLSGLEKWSEDDKNAAIEMIDMAWIWVEPIW